MGKIKRGLQLSASIMGICFSAVAFVFNVIYMIELGSYMTTVTFVFSGILIGINIASIVICSCMCPNPNKKKGRVTYTGLIVTALVLNFIVLCLICFMIPLGLTLIILLPEVIIIGLLVASLAVKEKEVEEVKTADFVNPALPKNESEELKISDTDAKINEIKALYADGSISEIEMRQLILQLLNKYFKTK